MITINYLTPESTIVLLMVLATLLTLASCLVESESAEKKLWMIAKLVVVFAMGFTFAKYVFGL